MGSFLRVKMFNPVESEINFDSFTKFSLFLFRFVFFAFEPKSESGTLKTNCFYTMKMTYCRFNLVSFVVGISSMITYVFVSSDDFLIAASVFANAVSVSLIALKAFTTYLRKDEIWKILGEMKIISGLRGSEHPEYKIKKHLDDYHRMIKFYAGVFVFVFVPVAAPAIPYLLFGTMNLMVKYWFPFDAYRPENFPYALLWCDWMAYNCLIFLLAADSLLFALIAVAAMEFDILKIDLMELEFSSNVELSAAIERFTERHVKLLNISDKLQEIYGFSFFVSFGISSLIMCFVAFQLSTPSADMTAFTFYIPYLGMIGGQIFLLCFFGQKLIDSSLSVVDGVYNSNWIECDEHGLKRQLILIILRAQRPKKLTTMNFADISLPSFTTVRNFL